jgi:glycosyltransferase involved in cell wall biosynthesis
MKSMRITFFMPSLAGGGAEKMVLNLIRGLQDYPVQIDLLVAKAAGELARQIPKGINLVELNQNHVSSTFFTLIHFLRDHHPDILFSAVDNANLTAILAALLSGTQTKRVISVHQVGSKFRQIHHSVRERVLQLGIRLFFRFAHQIVAVSDGVAEDLIRGLPIKPSRIRTIANPILSYQQLEKLKNSSILKKPGEVRIVSAGRLVKEKDFQTLLAAFAIIRKQLTCHLTIYGEGPERERLENQRDALGLTRDIDFPGFTEDIFQALMPADLCVVSSLTEGFGNVIVESLACGVPVVSTDSPSGPREILQDGKFGRLVSIQQPESLAEAMLASLKQKTDRSLLQNRASDFTIEKIASIYYALFESLLRGDAS